MQVQINPLFSKGLFRLPKKDELIEIDSFNLSPDEVCKGFCYTIVGRGTMRQEEKDTIIKSIELLNKMFPGKYEEALKKARILNLFRSERINR